jgi:hypothetical protein
VDGANNVANRYQYTQMITFGAIGQGAYPQTIERSWESHWTSENTIDDIIAWLNANVETGFTNTMTFSEVNNKIAASAAAGVNPKILRVHNAYMTDCAYQNCVNQCNSGNVIFTSFNL